MLGSAFDVSPDYSGFGSLFGGGGSSGAATTGTAGGGITSLLSTAASFTGIPGASQIVQFVGSLFNQETSAPVAGTFNGRHSAVLGARLDDAQVNKGDAANYLRLAGDVGGSVEDAAVVAGYEAERCAAAGISAQTVWDGLAVGHLTDENIRLFNQAYAGRASYSKGGGLQVAAGVSLPALVNYGGRAQLVRWPAGSVGGSAPTATLSGLSFTGGGQGSLAGANAFGGAGTTPTLGQQATNVLVGAANGAVKGAMDAASSTPTGQQVKRDYLIDWVKDNQALALVSGLGLGFMVWRTVQSLFNPK